VIKKNQISVYEGTLLSQNREMEVEIMKFEKELIQSICKDGNEVYSHIM